MSHNQAARAVENCACAWVQFGATLRDLNLAEAIAARNRQATMRDPLPFAELPGLRYEPAMGNEALALAELRVMRGANEFAAR